MKVELPSDYPEAVPIIKIKSIRGVTDAECKELTEKLLEMVFYIGI